MKQTTTGGRSTHSLTSLTLRESKGQRATLVLETKRSREWDGFPENAIAIGENGQGDKLILLPNDSNPNELSDKIYVWLHETREIEKLADSINELGD